MSLADILEGINKWSRGETNLPKPPLKLCKDASPSTIASNSGGKAKKRKYAECSSENNKLPISPSHVNEVQDNDQIPALYLGDAPIITTIAQCEAAIKEIYMHKIIAVDCEGVNLGRTGKLCLVQIATVCKPYLFDIIEGGPTLFQHGLRCLLEDPLILKVMHDCRLDSDALFHEYQVNLQCVYDTQIGFAIVQRQQDGFTPLPVGLNTLLRRFGLGATNEAKDIMKEEMQKDPQFWQKRPMSDIALLYARQDVTHLCLVQRQIDAILSKSSRSNLLKYSGNYLAQYRNSATPVVHQNKIEGENTNSQRDRFVPQYGIKSWDDETAQSLERSANRTNKKST